MSATKRKITANVNAHQPYFSVGAELVAEKDIPFHSGAVSIQRIPAFVREISAPAIEVSSDIRASQTHFTFGTEIVAQKDASLHPGAVSTKRTSATVYERSAAAIQISTDVTAQQGVEKYRLTDLATDLLIFNDLKTLVRFALGDEFSNCTL